MSAPIVSNKMVVEAGTTVMRTGPAAEDAYEVTWNFDALDTDGQIISFLLGASDNTGASAIEVQIERLVSTVSPVDGGTYSPAYMLRIVQGTTLAEAVMLTTLGYPLVDSPTTLTMCIRHDRVSVNGLPGRLWASVTPAGRYYGVKAVSADATITNVSIQKVTHGDDADEEGDPSGDCAACYCMETELVIGDSIQDLTTRVAKLTVSGSAADDGDYSLPFYAYTFDAIYGCICAALFVYTDFAWNLKVFCDGTIQVNVMLSDGTTLLNSTTTHGATGGVAVGGTFDILFDDPGYAPTTFRFQLI